MAENPTVANLQPVTVSNPETETRYENIPTPRIIVQGGAHYTLRFDTREEELLETMSQAAYEGYRKLKDGGTAVDAVEKAVRLLEDNKYFNAGHGSLLTNNGEVECDAMIMDGDTMNTGAVMGARHFSNPVSISRKIMEESYHCALSGDGALKFAEKIGFTEICEPGDLIEEETSLKHKFDYESYPEFVESYFGGNTSQDPQECYTYGKVSAIALDENGRLACATSTGGIPGKWKGRIGDAPLIGCGGYANKHGAATACGHGEAIMKMTLAREVVHNMEMGQNAEDSARNAVQRMKDTIDGYGGAIAIDKNGKFGKATNSAVMLWASIKDDELEYGMEKKKILVTNKFKQNKQ